MVSEKASQLPRYHRHAVGGKLHVLVKVETVHRLDKPYASDLKQVVHALAAAGEALYNGQDKAEVAGNELFPRLRVTLAGAAQQFTAFAGFQHGQLRGVYTAYLNFSLHSLSPFTSVIISRRGKFDTRAINREIQP